MRTIDLVEQRCGDTPEARLSVETLREMASQALADLRRVTRDLRPTTLDRLGLLAAIRSLAGETASRSKLHVDVRVGEAHPLPQELELCVFRVIQEALANVEKHARATSVVVEVACAEGEMRVEVRDDGIGAALPADPNDFARQGRFGILGMKERAELSGGTLEVTAEPGRGTCVLLRIPTATGRLAS